MSFNNLLIERHGRIALIVLNRPKVLNALDSALISELCTALDGFETDTNVGAVVITGSEKAFAAGADIKEMQGHTSASAYLSDLVSPWDRVAHFRKPIVAAVAGFALGGGCELAMMCDMIIAAETAKFGQPEVSLGIIPGAGGTQRLTHAFGKAKAMDLCLTGRLIDAREAERSGLVARVLPADGFLQAVMVIAGEIADRSLVATMMTKEAINRAFEVSLGEGLRFERRMFHSAFGTKDQKEGMEAFVSKRLAQFVHS